MNVIASPKRVRVGDLFGVELPDSSWVIGIVLHISKRFTQAMLISFFDKEFESIEQITAKLLGNQMITIMDKSLPNYTGKAILTQGDWAYLGNFPEIARNIPLPVLSVGRSYYKGDEVLNESMVRESEYFGPLVGLGRLSIEEMLSEYFSRKPSGQSDR